MGLPATYDQMSRTYCCRLAISSRRARACSSPIPLRWARTSTRAWCTSVAILAPSPHTYTCASRDTMSSATSRAMAGSFIRCCT